MILGIDYGTAKVGLALAEDRKGALTLPLSVIRFKDEGELEQALKDVAQEHNIEKIVIGLPGSMDTLEKLISLLKKIFNIEPEFVSEYLSTRAATRLIKEAGKDSFSIDEEDAIAASLILETYLEKKYSADNT